MIQFKYKKLNEIKKASSYPAFLLIVKKVFIVKIFRPAASGLEMTISVFLAEDAEAQRNIGIRRIDKVYPYQG